MKQVVIKFVVAKGVVSAAMYWLFRHKYTHVAISLQEDVSEFYSFTHKGFTKEGRRRNIPTNWKENYAYYILDVSDSAYLALTDKLNDFKAMSKLYSYSYLTLICAFFRISYKSATKYTCSYFVAKLLAESDAVKLKKTPELYLPNHLAKELNLCRKIEYYAFG